MNQRPSGIPGRHCQEPNARCSLHHPLNRDNPVRRYKMIVRQRSGAPGTVTLISILVAELVVGCSGPKSTEAGESGSLSSPGGAGGSAASSTQTANQGGNADSSDLVRTTSSTSPSSSAEAKGGQGGTANSDSRPTSTSESGNGGLGIAATSRASLGGVGGRSSVGTVSTETGGVGIGGQASGGAKTSGTEVSSTGGAKVNIGGASGASSATTGGAGVGGASSTTTVGNGTGGSSSADIIANLQNGVFWNDTSGKRIEAHGGGFILIDDTWYWVGEDKSASSAGFKAVNCYSSKDLEHWKLENDIITRSTASELAASDRIIERPKVVYNDSTKQYVMWLHWEGNNYAEAKAGVFTSSSVCGDYVYKSSFRPNNNMSRDDTLFKDDDGKAYFLSAANENADLILYELSSDYLTIARQVAVLWAGAKREAPALFKHDGRYYLITSACTGWDPNQAQYATATSIGGPWSSLQNIGNGTTYDTQSTYVIPVVGTKTTTYVYAGDRWQDPDLASSKYIWLPLKLNGTKLSLDYYDKWQLNVTTGEWSTNFNDGFVPQSGWKLIRADSQETSEEDGSATNAFDNSASTIWHTAYTGTTPKHPHEIQIDLGATYDIQGMRCLPRQDKDANGIIADYEFYATEDASNWGTKVASGTFDSTRNEHVVTFPRMNARYIRLVALSEINGGAWTSLAELDLVPAQ